MEFGCCCAIEQAGAAQAAGFDFVECTVVSLEPEVEDGGAGPILARFEGSPLPVRSFNVFLPRELKVTGPLVEWPRVERYLENALARAQRVGARTVVFGSGGSRSVPEGFPRAEAEEQLVRFLRLAGDVAADHGIVIAIEPLNRRESNILNSVAEAAALAARVNRPAIRVLADFYHMDEEGEPLEHLLAHRAWLAHIHVADFERAAPGTGTYPYARFFGYLHQIGYGQAANQRIAVECRWRNFAAEAPAAVAFMRRAWEQAAAAHGQC